MISKPMAFTVVVTESSYILGIGEHVAAVYAWLKANGMGAFIPIDNQRMVERQSARRRR